jgi:hypothetical protein
VSKNEKNLFVRDGHPLVSKVAYEGNLEESIELSVSLIAESENL